MLLTHVYLDAHFAELSARSSEMEWDQDQHPLLQSRFSFCSPKTNEANQAIALKTPEHQKYNWQTPGFCCGSLCTLIFGVAGAARWM